MIRGVLGLKNEPLTGKHGTDKSGIRVGKANFSVWTRKRLEFLQILFKNKDNSVVI